MRAPARGMAIALIATAVCASAARSSLIVAPDVSVRDGGMGGNVVATPTDGASTLLVNPAGVTRMRGTRLEDSIFLLFTSGRYSNAAIGYDTKSSELPVAPTLWIGTDKWRPWFFGFGLYGTAGASFNFPGNPATGIPNRFLSEFTVIQAGFVAGVHLTETLRLGAQVAPTYGAIKVRTGSPLGPVRYDIDGIGVNGVVGLLWEATRTTTFGLSWRSPTVIPMSGDGDVGDADEEVEIDFHTPQLVTFGLAHRLTPKLTVSLQARWSDYPEFEKGEFEFQNFPMLNQPFVSGARSTFRYGAGLEYAVAPWADLWLGVSREEWMIEEKSLSPLLYDTTDVLIGFGTGISRGRWTIRLVGGVASVEDRVATADSNPRFPGRYQLEGGVAGLGIRYLFSP